MIAARSVTKRFGSFTAVDDVSLEVNPGEFLTLLGPSGCGKTTLLRIFAGLEAPDAGGVFLGGEDVTALPPYRRDVNQVFQSYALFPHLSVGDNIAFGLRMRGVARGERARRVAEVVETVSLGGLEGRMPHQLSGGQRQRVALARALVCRPKVLLLDEPLSALDAKLRHEMREELARLQRKVGLTFVFVTHDQQEALAMSDRIALMNRGRIEQIGTPREIYRSPRTRFAADFVGQANLLEGVLDPVDGSTCRLRLPGGVVLTVAAAAAAAGERVLASIRPEGITLSPTPPAGRGGFEGRVVDRVFQGPNELVRVSAPDGTLFQVLVGCDGAAGSFPLAGDRVFCSVRPADIALVARI